MRLSLLQLLHLSPRHIGSSHVVSIAVPTPQNGRSLVVDIAVTAVMLAGLGAGTFELGLGTGPIRHISSMIFDGLGFFLGPVLLFVPVERLMRPAGQRKSIHVWLLHFRINILFYLAVAVAGMLSTAITAKLGSYFHLGLIDLRFSSGKGVAGVAGAVLLSLVIGDFFYYWWHRVSHRPFLWQSHKLHHMDPEMDVLTNMRDSWTDASVIFFQSLPMVILFKLDATEAITAGGIFGFVLASYNFFFHMNIRLGFGKATAFIVGPQWHRIHHSRLRVHRDKNFASMFPVWDVLFGTYYHPAHDEFPPTGVEGEKEIQSFREATIFTFREWLKMYRSRRARRDVPTDSSTNVLLSRRDKLLGDSARSSASRS